MIGDFLVYLCNCLPHLWLAFFAVGLVIVIFNITILIIASRPRGHVTCDALCALCKVKTCINYEGNNEN